MGQIAIGGILLAVGIILMVAVLPVARSVVEKAIRNGTGNATSQTSDDVTGSDATLLRLIPTVLVFGIIGIGLAFLVSGFRSTGR